MKENDDIKKGVEYFKQELKNIEKMKFAEFRAFDKEYPLDKASESFDHFMKSKEFKDSIE